jgi:hypothetical protein
MNCLFVLKVLTTLAVYNMAEANPNYSQRTLTAGDKACVTSIEKGFLGVSYSRGYQQDYTGYVWTNVNIGDNTDASPGR